MSTYAESANLRDQVIPRPDMSPEEIAYLEAELRPADSVFEWGSGYSTIWLAQRVTRVLSVEHQEHWALKVASHRLPNVDVIFAPPNKPYQEGESDGDAETFADYVTSYRPADVVLVDGRARVACARYLASRQTNPDAPGSTFGGSVVHWQPRAVFLHDAQRSEYHEVFKVLRETGRAGHLVRFVLP